MLTEKQIERLEKQQYRVVGKHSVVKICFWTKECLRKDRHCYKSQFYDAHTINCLEMSPVLTCNQRCRHCWRDTSIFSKGFEGEYDEPKDIIKGCIEQRKKLLIGFKGNDCVNQEKFNESLKVDHAAISLTGEPTLYPKLHLLIDSFFDDFNFRTVYLVTNGTVPEMIKKFGKESKHFPTNLYVSLESWDEKSHKKFNVPVVKDTWNNLLETMKYLSTIKDKTRTIIRLTAVKDFNMDKAKEFAKIIKIMKPKHIEVKGYAFLGYSQMRLDKEKNSPTWEETQKFAEELAKECGYKITDKHEPSDIVQLTEQEEN